MSVVVAEPTLKRVHAWEIKPGDTVIANGFIPLTITDVRCLPVNHTVIAHYESAAGPGIRMYADTQSLTVARPAEQAAH